MLRKQYGIVVFDGVCNLCNGGVHFVARRSKSNIRFVAAQTPKGEQVLASVSLTNDDVMKRFAYIDPNQQVHRASGAALRIAAGMNWPWPVFSALLLIPPPIRDFAYDVIARHRYRMFGKTDTCQLIPKDMRDRFLE
eukprot:Hpha_TRINITY_DN24760_c0_g1::TRINITY_DN24760_c0_g1_i1::g.110265::m.110265